MTSTVKMRKMKNSRSRVSYFLNRLFVLKNIDSKLHAQ